MEDALPVLQAGFVLVLPWEPVGGGIEAPMTGDLRP